MARLLDTVSIFKTELAFSIIAMLWFLPVLCYLPLHPASFHSFISLYPSWLCPVPAVYVGSGFAFQYRAGICSPDPVLDTRPSGPGPCPYEMAPFRTRVRSVCLQPLYDCLLSLSRQWAHGARAPQYSDS